jgi:hypothetical protein
MSSSSNNDITEELNDIKSEIDEIKEDLQDLLQPEIHYDKLLDLVKATPGLNWEFEHLNRNLNISLAEIAADWNTGLWIRSILSERADLTLDFILEFPDTANIYQKWDWRAIFTNSKQITLRVIEQHLDMISQLYPEFYIDYYFSHKIIDDDPSFLLRHPYEFNYDWKLFSRSISLKFIFSNFTLPWDLQSISVNTTMDLESIMTHPEIKWDPDIISLEIPLTDLLSQTKYPINYDFLSGNPTLTTNYFLENLDKKWNQFWLSGNESLDFNMLADHDADLSKYFDINVDEDDPDYYAENLILYRNKSITLKFINKYNLLYKYNWYINGIIKLEDVLNDYENFKDYMLLSDSPHLESWFVIANSDKKWDWYAISKNKAFKMSDVIEMIQALLPINYPGLSENPNITFDFIWNNREKAWDMVDLSSNTFIIEYLKNKYKEDTIKRIVTQTLSDILISDINNLVIEY